jgi:hypothetical protein
LGRFLTQDSLIPDVTNGQALNPYAYVYNDPINLVDPSGNIPSLGSIGGALGDAAVGAAKRAPDSWKPWLRDTARTGNKVIDYLHNQPDDCDCTQRQTALPEPLLPLANFSVQAYWGGKATTAVRMIGTHSVEHFSTNSWTWMKGVETAVDVTGWRGVRARSLRTFLTGSFKVTQRHGLSRQIVRNARPQWVPGIKGMGGAVIGSGAIDGVFQLISDLINGLCASRAQWFNRWALATFFGVGAGAAAALAASGAVGIGATAGVAAATGVVIGFGFSYIYGKVKQAIFRRNSDLFGGT